MEEIVSLISQFVAVKNVIYFMEEFLLFSSISCRSHGGYFSLLLDVFFSWHIYLQVLTSVFSRHSDCDAWELSFRPPVGWRGAGLVVESQKIDLWTQNTSSLSLLCDLGKDFVVQTDRWKPDLQRSPGFFPPRKKQRIALWRTELIPQQGLLYGVSKHCIRVLPMEHLNLGVQLSRRGHFPNCVYCCYITILKNLSSPYTPLLILLKGMKAETILCRIRRKDTRKNQRKYLQRGAEFRSGGTKLKLRWIWKNIICAVGGKGRVL